MRIDHKIISSLIYDAEYATKVLPHIEALFFQNKSERRIFEEIKKYFNKYNQVPSQEIIKIELANRQDITDHELQETYELVDQFVYHETNRDWLIQKTEKFCKDQAVYNAVLKSITVIEGKDTQLTRDAIPKLLSDALAISFDTNIGHEYLIDTLQRYQFLHQQENKIPFDIDLLNQITAGGLSKKSLNVVLAGTGAGKSLFMCHLAASSLLQGFNVLYITLEMAEERIAERIDANILDVPIDQLNSLDQERFESRISKIRQNTQGRLIIKEYPTAAAHSGHFRALIEELKIKRQFRPDLIIIDYINICASARIKLGGATNTYVYVKAVAEELRGLAVEYSVPLLTATQTTRSGYDNTDVDLTDTSESFGGCPTTSDLMFALIRSEELDKLNQLVIKQLKNRYADPAINKRFVVSVDRSKMKLYNCDNDQQYLADLEPSIPVHQYRPKTNKSFSNDFNF